MSKGKTRDFLDLDLIDLEELRQIITSARSMKDARKNLGKGVVEKTRPLEGNVLAMVFEKPSTRTRVSFDIGMRQLGGETIVLSGADMQLGHGETIADTARVLSRYVDIIMLRATAHSNLEELAQNASVPVINGLTDNSHPCQVMADVMTFEEHKGPIEGRKIAWVGDGNNVAASWIHASSRFGFELSLACPAELSPDGAVMSWAKDQSAKVSVMQDPAQAVEGAHCVVTDTWVSMGDKDGAVRHNLLKPYQVTSKLMAKAQTDAIFMHCLPAHREEEVTGDVIDGPQSVVFDEAENRLHIQKAILAWCMSAEI